MGSSKNYSDGVEAINVRVPSSVMRQVRIILLDPATGQIGYGRMANLVTSLLTNWLEEKKKNIDEVVLEGVPEDKFKPYSNEGE